MIKYCHWVDFSFFCKKNTIEVYNTVLLKYIMKKTYNEHCTHCHFVKCTFFCYVQYLKSLLI